MLAPHNGPVSHTKGHFPESSGWGGWGAGGVGGGWQLDAFFLLWSSPPPLHEVSPPGGAQVQGLAGHHRGGWGLPIRDSGHWPGNFEFASARDQGEGLGLGAPSSSVDPEASVRQRGDGALVVCLRLLPAQESPPCLLLLPLAACGSRGPMAPSPRHSVSAGGRVFLVHQPLMLTKDGWPDSLRGGRAPRPPDHSYPCPGLGN